MKTSLSTVTPTPLKAFLSAAILMVCIAMGSIPEVNAQDSGQDPTPPHAALYELHLPFVSTPNESDHQTGLTDEDGRREDFLTYIDPQFGFGFLYRSTLSQFAWQPAEDILASSTFAHYPTDSGAEQTLNELNVTVYANPQRLRLTDWLTQHLPDATLIGAEGTNDIFRNRHETIMTYQALDGYGVNRILIAQDNAVVSSECVKYFETDFVMNLV